MSSYSLELYEFNQKLEELANCKGRATELVSLYIPPTKKIHDIASYLRNEASQSANIKSKSTRKNVSAAIESITSRLKAYKEPPEKGMVFFVGHVDKGSNQTAMMQDVVIPPETIQTFTYRCDNRFFLEPLEEMKEVKDVYGLIVIDRSEATIGLLKGSVVKTLKHMYSQVPSKHGKGGQSKRRFERLIEEAAHEWYKRIAENCLDFFTSNDIKSILIGGPGATKDFFNSNEFLNHELQKIVMDTFDTGYTDETGLKELVSAASTRLAEVQLIKDKELMDRFMKEVLSGKLSCYGVTQVQKALSMGAVEILLISELFEQDNPDISAENGDSFVKYLAETASASSADVFIISRDTEEGTSLRKAFNGLAAILRYPIN